MSGSVDTAGAGQQGRRVRADDRAPDQLRPVAFERQYTRHAAGSVLASFGDTKVICTATYDDRVPPWLRDSGQGWVTAEYAMLPGSTHTRTSRDAAKKGRALEISRLIGRSLRAVVDLHAIGACQITVDCDVIQADGGTRTAAITGGFVALYDALQWAVGEGNLSHVPVLSTCAAISVGIVDGVPLLDLCYEEDYDAAVDMNIVMTGEGEYIEVQGTAEERSFPRSTMDAMLGLGEIGIRELTRMQREVLDLA